MIDAKAIDVSGAWKRQGILLASLVLAMLVLYYPTFESIVAIWSRSDTFAHGFFIVPISLWLIWRIRDQVLATEPKANYLGIPALLLLGLIWLLANYIGVLAAEQLAAVMMLLVLVFTVLGWRTTTTMAFPLLFVLLAVPIGEELTPVLIDFTADFTVTMIQMVGIPIYREGNFFQLPTGNWSVVAACSGVRYLIASVTLGVLYAYLNYQSPVKRGLFVVAAFVVPIIANGLRAFMIVMIGHFSDMQLATGVDHIIYGWVFFGIVIGIMFYIGSFWRDDMDDIKISALGFNVGNMDCKKLSYKVAVAFTAVTLIAGPLKLLLEQQVLNIDNVGEVYISAPQGWQALATDASVLKIAYRSLDREFISTYTDEIGRKVTLFIGYYAEQRQGAELGNSENVLVGEKDEFWRVVIGQDVALPGMDVNVPTAELLGGADRYLTAYFFYADGQWLTNKYESKLIQAKARLLGGRNDAAVIVMTTASGDDASEALVRLRDFAGASLSNIRLALDGMQ